MTAYYFLASFLPPLFWGQPPEFSFEQLKDWLSLNLTREDRQEVARLLSFQDICNIRLLLSEEPVDPRGNLNEKELDEAILFMDVLPDYVFVFLDQFESINERIRHFSGVLALFFREEMVKGSKFLQKYFAFEREWRLVQLALRCKRLGRDVVAELQFEDLGDPLVVQILAQKDADSYDPPAEYQALKELLQVASPDPWAEYEAFARYRFDKIGELIEGSAFSLDTILAYVAQSMILEHRFELDFSKGKMILDTFKTG